MTEKKTTKITIPILQAKIAEMYQMMEKQSEINKRLEELVTEKSNTIQLQVQRINSLATMEMEFDVLKKEIQTVNDKLNDKHSLLRYMEGVVKGKDDMIAALKDVIATLTGKKGE